MKECIFFALDGPQIKGIIHANACIGNKEARHGVVVTVCMVVSCGATNNDQECAIDCRNGAVI
jgi:hypothetical protein